jgi:hypothetical protein
MDDEIDTSSNSPLLDSGSPLQRTSVRVPVPLTKGPQASGCAICCTIFSLIAAVILSLVASYIASGSPYIIVDKDPAHIDMKKRGGMAFHMYLAAGMYLLCSLIAGYFWKNPRPNSKID